MIKPNANFTQIIDSIPALCSDFTQNDAIIIIAGTNDFSYWFPNASKRFNLSPLNFLVRKTNIIINSVPARFDSFYSKAAMAIYNSNFGLQDWASRNGFLYFDSFSFLKRPYFTRHGLHLNWSGKRVFALKMKNFILEHICDALKRNNLSTQPTPNFSQSRTNTSSFCMSPSLSANLEKDSFRLSPSGCSSPMPMHPVHNASIYQTPLTNPPMPIPTLSNRTGDCNSPSYFLRRKRNTITT